MVEGGLYSVTALRETWARRRCILNTRIYHKQASTTSKAHFTRGSSSLSGSHSASSASVASSLCGVLRFRGFVLVRRECVRVGGDRKASLALGLTRPVCRTPVPVGSGVPRSSEGAGAPKVHIRGRLSGGGDWTASLSRSAVGVDAGGGRRSRRVCKEDVRTSRTVRCWSIR